MALQYKVDSLDGVTEAHKGFYIKVGETYQLDVEGVEDVSELKSTAKARKEERDALKKQLKDLDIERSAAEKARLEEKGEYKTLAEKHAAESLAYSTELSDLKSKLAETARKSTAGTVIADITKGVDVSRAKLMKEQALKFIQTDEAGNTIIVGPEGISDSGKLAEHLKTAFPFLAGASPAGGGGGNGGSTSPLSENLLNLSPIERINAARAEGK